MTKLWLSALVLAVMATGVHAQDGRYANADDNAHYGWADVLRADPVQGVTRTEVPRQECYEQPVVRREGGNSTAGTVLGAVIGGVLGNTVGKGDGRKAATVVGAVAGGAVGRRSRWRVRNHPDPVSRGQLGQRAAPDHRLRRGIPLSRRGLHVAPELRSGRASARARAGRSRRLIHPHDRRRHSLAAIFFRDPIFLLHGSEIAAIMRTRHLVSACPQPSIPPPY